LSDQHTTVVWLRRDLRLADNPALASACATADRVVLLYVHAPDEEGDWPAGAASRWWLHHSLERFSASLATQGARLHLRRGPSLQALLAVAHASGASRVCWNRLYEPALASRDARVAEALRDAGLEVQTSNASALVEPWDVHTADGRPYRVFTPYWRRCVARLAGLAAPLPAPRIVSARLEGEELQLAGLDLLPRLPWDAGLARAWTPGESGALDRLDQFCESILGDYASSRDRPDLDGTSRLSPHLHFGEIGPRQCLAAIHAATAARPGQGAGADAFLRELGWREFASHVLHHFPGSATEPLDPRFAAFPWAPNPTLLEAWRRGRTGYPLVDAGLRQLWETGWMHNRVRMVAASLLTKNLRQHWLEGARWFWDTLVDADLANNSLGWQWVAGSGADAPPYFRIFNPTLQADRHDPQGAYVRRWLPEREVTPMPPLCDFRETRASALAAYASLPR
jgi:deoxyribodipyrimidine photo-lyase